MGLRGKPPTPKAVLAARGSWRAKDRDEEMQLPPGVPERPVGLDATARAEWRRLVALLGPKSVLTEADRAGLTMLCELWSEDRALGKVLADMPIGTTDWKRVFIARQDVRRQLKDMLTKFGLTPADRPRVKVGKSEVKDDGKGRFFSPKLAV